MGSMRLTCVLYMCVLVVSLQLPLATAFFNLSHADPEAVLRKLDAVLLQQMHAQQAQAPHMQGVDVPWKRGWTQYWQDEFSGTSLDRSKWDFNYAWGRTHNHNGVMEERMVTVSGGQLHLRAENTRSSYAPPAKTVDGRWLTFDYTSGAIHSSNHFRMSNGYIETSVRFPQTKGFWPAAWMLSNGWPPEIDLVEHLTDLPTRATYNYHYTGSSGITSTGGSTTSNSFESDFHIYGVEWNSGTAAPYIRFYLDNVMIGCCTFTSAFVNQATNMYMMFNLGVGGWAANPDGSTDWSKAVYDVDWVRVWRP